MYKRWLLCGEFLADILTDSLLYREVVYTQGCLYRGSTTADNRFQE